MSPHDNEQGEIRPQTADGIQECDNPLPTWWIGLFILTGIFGVSYISYVHFLGGKGQIEKYNIAQTKREAAALTEVEQDNTSANPTSPSTKATTVASAEADFQTNCSACHLADGSGSIGPNLTDNYWIHGGDEKSIRSVIEIGVLEKGMPPWKDILGTKKINALVDLIVSWRGKDLKGKEPQGEIYESSP